MKEEVHEALEKWLPNFGLPPKPDPGVKDLRGRDIRVLRMDDEATVRFFFPRRSLIFQQQLIKGLTRGLRQRGAKIATVKYTAEDYARWLEVKGQEDTPALRYMFATVPPEF